MEFLTDHLLNLNVTSEECMRRIPAAEQHSNFARQLSALEKLLLISHSRLALDELHQKLKLVLKAGPKGMLKITSLNSLQECVNMYTQSKGASADDRQEASDFFARYIDEVHFLTRIQEFFHKTIYHCLYEKFYDPILDDSEDEYRTGLSSDSDDDDAPAESRNGLVNSPENVRTVANLQKAAVNKSKQPPSNAANIKMSDKKRVGKRKKRVDNRLKVLQEIQEKKAEREVLVANQKLDESRTGAEFEAIRNKSDNQRLAFSVQRIYQIQGEWRRMITSGPIDTANFDKDSLRNVKHYKNYIPFEAVFRLIPDLLVKGFKLVELSKFWYNSFRRLHGPEQVVHRTATIFEEQIGQFEKSARSVEQLMEKKRNIRSAKQKERRMVLNQLMRLDQLKDKHQQCSERESDLKDYYKQLKSERSLAYPKLEKLDRDDTEYREVYDHIQYLAGNMKNIYKELQTASYELALIKQDFNIELGHRTQIIHQQNDIKQIIADIDESLVTEQEERLQYLHISEKLGENCIRMRRALYPKMPIDSRNKVPKSKQYRKKINKNSRKKPSSGDAGGDSDLDKDEVVVEKAVEFAIEQLDQERDLDSTTPVTPLAPAYPPEVADKKTKQPFNPTSSGLTDESEAKDYDDRVERLKKGVELDFSALQVVVDCEMNDLTETERPVHVVESGDEGDEESEEELEQKRPQSKKQHRRTHQRYSPLSDASDEYIYRQPYPIRQVPGAKDRSPRTVYILKKSVPKRQMTKAPQLILPSSDEDERNPRLIDTLSMYKRTPVALTKPGPPPNTLTPLLPLEHTEGIFTPHKELSDGDISEDSGTGNSLDSENDNHPTGPVENEESDGDSDGYRHKSRIPVREQLQSLNKKPVQTKSEKQPPVKPVNKPLRTKLPQPIPVNEGVRKSDKVINQVAKALKPVEDTNSKLTIPAPVVGFAKVPVDHNVTPILPLSPSNVGDRHTLFMQKPIRPLKVIPKPTKPVKIPLKPATVPTIQLSRKNAIPKKPALNVKHPAKYPPHKLKQISPRNVTMPIQILESASDDDTNEVFRQQPVVFPIMKNKPKPAGNRQVPPMRGRRNGGVRSLGRVY